MNNKKESNTVSRREALKKISKSAVAGIMITNWGFNTFTNGLIENADTPLTHKPGQLQACIKLKSGVPQLFINESPVRARMFWGAPSSKWVNVSPNARLVNLDFMVTQESTGGNFSVRFKRLSGDVFFDDFQITDLITLKKIFKVHDFEDGKQIFTGRYSNSHRPYEGAVGELSIEQDCGRNRSKGLLVKLISQEIGGAKWSDFVITLNAHLPFMQGHLYRLSFWVRSEVQQTLCITLPHMGRFCFLPDSDGDDFQMQIKLAGQAGVNIVTFHVGVPWPAPGETVNFSAFDLPFKRVLDANPNALLLPRISLVPPSWWINAHPDEAMTWEDGTKDKRYAVPGSVYVHDAAKQLVMFVHYLESKFGDHIIGYHPAGHNSSEWFYINSWGSLLNGYAPADLREWKTWLKRHYGSDIGLRQAWGDERITIKRAKVPSAAERHAALEGVFHNPISERRVIDFSEFQHELMADCICKLAQAVRKETKGKKLIATFYGYVFEHGAKGGMPSRSGHFALRQVLQCPDIDILSAPISYFGLGLGGNGASMTAAESVSMAGKMWFQEDDIWTYLSTGGSSRPLSVRRVDTLNETNQLLIRNTGQCALRNFGTWWMDLDTTGWFNDPGMWNVMKKLEVLDQSLLKNPLPYRPQVAAVIDPIAMIKVSGGNEENYKASAATAVTSSCAYLVTMPLGRMGAPYGQYLLDDVTAGKVQSKMYVMLTTWYFTQEQRKQLLQATYGATKIWCYAPGFLDPHGTSLEAMHELTGFKMRKIDIPYASAHLTTLGKRMGLKSNYGVSVHVNPLFAAADATKDEALATYSDGSAAIAMRQMPEGLSIFVGTPGLTSELLRLVARKAGVHLFTDVDCNIYGNGPYLVIHTSQDGPLTINTGSNSAAIDMLSGENLGKGPRIILPIKMGESRVMKIS